MEISYTNTKFAERATEAIVLMPLESLIDLETPCESAICLHEAGHAVAALMCEAKLIFLELIDDPQSQGTARNRIQTSNQEQRRFVACAGFAVEYNLFKQNRLIDSTGGLLSEKAFIQQSLGKNAALDKRQFFDANLETNGFWPKDYDEEFMNYGIAVARSIPMDVVFAVAEELLRLRRLECEQVCDIVDAVQGMRK